MSLPSRCFTGTNWPASARASSPMPAVCWSTASSMPPRYIEAMSRWALLSGVSWTWPYLADCWRSRVRLSACFSPSRPDDSAFAMVLLAARRYASGSASFITFFSSSAPLSSNRCASASASGPDTPFSSSRETRALYLPACSSVSDSRRPSVAFVVLKGRMPPERIASATASSRTGARDERLSAPFVSTRRPGVGLRHGAALERLAPFRQPCRPRCRRVPPRRPALRR